jgi:hypothetical protein
MRARPMPANAKWAEWPTLDSLLKAYPDIKLRELRRLLRAVPCYKAEDNTTRYRPEEAEAALRLADVEPDDDDDDDQGDGGQRADADAPSDHKAFDEAVATLPAPVLLVVLREQRRWFSDAAQAMRDALRTMGETIRLQAEPLRMGIQMNKEGAERNAAELAKHRKDYARMIDTTDDLMSERVDRELKEARARQSLQHRTEMIAFFKEHAGSALQKWQLTAQGTAALGFLRSLDPVVVMMARAQGFITDEQMGQLRTVRSDLPPEPDTSASAPTDTVQ